jgi:hypothetical protein
VEMLEKIGKHIWESSKSTKGYWLTRFVFLRLLGFIYLIAFISLAIQVIPLIGANGLLPADNFLNRASDSYSSSLDGFFALPSVFWFYISDNALLILSWLGVILSLVVLIGYANSILMFILWALYMSFVHIGQLWYSYGWEIQLLETGFLAIFIVPLFDMRPFPKAAPPIPIIWLLRWLTFRLYMGTGLIKFRGDSCWSDLTCLFYHYETQPIPNPLSPYFHFLPQWFHKLGVLYSHFASLVAPLFIFGPIRTLRYAAGFVLLLFQVILLVNGNYAFLNILAIIVIVAVFDDKLYKKVLPKFIVKKAEYAEKNAKFSKDQFIISWIAVILVVMLSVPVVVNMLSSNQAMNTSFNQLHIVNTYGAFGSVGKVRTELVVQGTTDIVLNENTVWKEYEFKYKPTDVNGKLPQIAPYQPRIDWQIWFAAFSRYDREPWMIHFAWKLLHNDPGTISLIAKNPFPDMPPNFIRIEHYRYEFLEPGSDAVWKRTYLGPWLFPVSKETQGMREFVRANGWGVKDT